MLDTTLKGVHPSAGEPLPFAPATVVRAFTLDRPAGDLVVYAAPGFQDRGGITAQLQYVDLHGLPPDYPNTYVKKVFAVTPQQVTEMAKKYLKDDQATIVIVGDRQVVEQQVSGFGKLADK